MCNICRYKWGKVNNNNPPCPKCSGISATRGKYKSGAIRYCCTDCKHRWAQNKSSKPGWGPFSDVRIVRTKKAEIDVKHIGCSERCPLWARCKQNINKRNERDEYITLPCESISYEQAGEVLLPV